MRWAMRRRAAGVGLRGMGYSVHALMLQRLHPDVYYSSGWPHMHAQALLFLQSFGNCLFLDTVLCRNHIGADQLLST
jgi:hypothetical protein